MRKLVFVCSVLVVSVLSFGCYTTQVRQYSGFDPSEKTIFVPVGEGVIVGGLKDVLREEGWKVFVKENKERITEGTDGENTNLKTHDLVNARYSLFISATVQNNNIAGQDYRYELSIVDNKTGQEVFTLHGFDTEGGIANHLKSALQTAY